jgi:hypothetical protein
MLLDQPIDSISTFRFAVAVDWHVTVYRAPQGATGQTTLLSTAADFPLVFLLEDVGRMQVER